MSGRSSAALITHSPGDDPLTVLSRQLSPGFLAEIGWCERQRKVVFPQDHRLLGWTAPKGTSGRQLTRVYGEASLDGLPPLVVTQILFGLQRRCRNGSRTHWRHLALLCDRARQLGAQTIEQLPPDRDFLRNTLATAVRRALLHPDTERVKDRWHLVAFGLGGGFLNFTNISQPWLREATKVWAFDYLPTRSGRAEKIASAVQTRVAAMARLSESLHLQRPDHGNDFTALGAADIAAFCNRMAFLAAEGRVTARLRLATCRHVRVVLDGFRLLGLTRAGQLLVGLPEDFALRRGQVPDETDDDEPGKDLPNEVMLTICEHLDRLGELCGPESQTAIELAIDTGRRPEEICELPWDCVAHDAQGQPLLVYHNFKAKRTGRRLPIASATAEVITAQRVRVRLRFPDTPVGELKLLPSAQANPDGRKALSTSTLGTNHKRWLAELPSVTAIAETNVDGQVVAVQLPFDLSRIQLYAYRHTYAQRHADAGVPVDVLRELMDHRRMDTTQRYYSIGHHRRREAIDRVAHMQFDRQGSRIWRDAKTLLDEERTRMAVGEVAVPYGGCSEPSNVAAGGGACPIRFRCLGCGHFSTDASYLPDLEAYLADLLRNRERLLASRIDADDWARVEATPSTEEITRVRRLVQRIRSEMDDLSSAERSEIEQAVAVIRRGRVALRIHPVAGQSLNDLRPGRAA